MEASADYVTQISSGAGNGPHNALWRRLACPQPDSYDTKSSLELAVGEGYDPTISATGKHWLDGSISVDDTAPYLAKTAIAAPNDHPNIETGAHLLALWPELYFQTRRLLHRVAFFVDSRHDTDCVVGAVCGPGPDGFGSISTTVNNHVGVAEAIAHELAHHKLRALGVDVENAKRLIVNDPDELYPSPIRYDVNRPMTAVLHAQYSYVHIAALDIHIIDAALDRERDKVIVERSLAIILPKLAFGREVLNSHAELDDAGIDFMAGFDDWTALVISDGFKVLEDFAVAPIAFHHPLLKNGGSVCEERAECEMAVVPDDLSWRPALKPGIESHVVSDGLVLYDPSLEAAYSLNSESRAIWELCDGKRNITDIARQLIQGLDIEEDDVILAQLTDDVLSAVRRFRDDDLVVPRSVTVSAIKD